METIQVTIVEEKIIVEPTTTAVGPRGLPGVDAVLPPTATQPQAEDPAGTTVLMWTAQRVWQAILAAFALPTTVFKGILYRNPAALAEVTPGAAYTAIAGQDTVIHLTQDLTITMPGNPPAGQAWSMVHVYAQDATGGWLVTFPPATWDTASGLEVDTRDIAAGERRKVVWVNDGSGWVGHPLV